MENENSVAFIAKIDSIEPIIGADNIEKAIVGGWSCVIKKDQYTVGALMVCCTTDAVIPEELANNMGITPYLRKGNRVRTVKLKGTYSECLLIPFMYTTSLTTEDYKEGLDVMNKLGIFKYEPPIKNIQLSTGKTVRYHENPNFGIYYKFPNIKNVQGIFTEEDTVSITRKIHGTNARYGIVKKTKLSLWDKFRKFFGLVDKWIEYEFVVGSHNVEKGSDSQGYYETNVWYDINKKYQIKEKLWAYAKEHTIGSGVILYGEIYGKGIQKGYEYGLDTIEFVAFDIVESGRYLDTDMCETLIDLLQLPRIEELYYGRWSQEIQDKYVFNNFIKGTKIPHEGIVVKHISGNRKKVAKVINPDYLIYGEKHEIGDSH